MLPISIILLFNFVILVFVMKALTNRSIATQNVHSSSKLLKEVKITMACSVLLGLTWIFGLFAIGEATEVFQWLFTIFNSLQGFFIFIFYTLTSPEVQKEWKKELAFLTGFTNESHTSSVPSTTSQPDTTTIDRSKLIIIIIQSTRGSCQL